MKCGAKVLVRACRGGLGHAVRPDPKREAASGGSRQRTWPRRLDAARPHMLDFSDPTAPVRRHQPAPAVLTGDEFPSVLRRRCTSCHDPRGDAIALEKILHDASASCRGEQSDFVAGSRAAQMAAGAGSRSSEGLRRRTQRPPRRRHRPRGRCRRRAPRPLETVRPIPTGPPARHIHRTVAR